MSRKRYLLLDRSMEERRTEVLQLRQAVGVCRPNGAFRVENWLRGSFRLGCDHGWVDVTVTLAPTTPPAVQYLSFEEGHSLEPSLRTAIESQLASFGSVYGACTIGDAVSGNGRTDARVSLHCERGPVDLIVHADSDGRLDRARFMPPADAPCVP